MFHSIHFTLEQANNLLDELRPAIEEMMNLKKILDDKNYDIYRHEYFGGMGSNGTGAFPPEMGRLVEIIKSISEKGILIKGIDNGLIDFPFIRSNGEEVYLCWLPGEESISYWHRITDGFPGRKNLEEL
jgi:hypothetical protein